MLSNICYVCLALLLARFRGSCRAKTRNLYAVATPPLPLIFDFPYNNLRPLASRPHRPTAFGVPRAATGRPHPADSRIHCRRLVARHGSPDGLGRIGYKPVPCRESISTSDARDARWELVRMARRKEDRPRIRTARDNHRHSLGGVARDARIAASNPSIVREVIALGSPIRNGWTGVHDQVRPAMQAIQSFWADIFPALPKNCGTMECSCGYCAGSLRGQTPPARPASAAIYNAPRRGRAVGIVRRRPRESQLRKCRDCTSA